MGRISRKISGTPWHIETLKMSEDDERRHKSKCKYYDNGKCTININCYGSSRCKNYRVKLDKINKIKNNTSSKEEIFGTFKLKNLKTKELIEYKIGKNIYNNHILIDVVKNRNQNSIFIYNDDKYKIVSKNLYKRIK